MKNFVQKGVDINWTNTTGADVDSGDPVAMGELPGVANLDIANGSSGSVKTRGVVSLSVAGVDGSGNNAVAFGDKLYFVDADTPKINKKDTGVFFGYALGIVGGGATATINVRLP